MKESQKLINMEITREEIIGKSEYEVDSTTEETPVKKPKIIKDSKSKKVKTKKKKQLKLRLMQLREGHGRCMLLCRVKASLKKSNN